MTTFSERFRRQLAGELGRRQLAAREPLPDTPWQFLCDCAFTFDEHAAAKGLKTVRRFPQTEYLRYLTYLFETEHLLRIEKSRQLVVTWWLAAMFIWCCARPDGTGENNAWQSKKFDDADATLRKRLWHIYLNIPSRYAKPRARYVSGAIEFFHDPRTPLPTASIKAVAEGANQLRQYTFRRIASDEAGFQEKQAESFGGMKPTIDGGGQLIEVSSANGHNFFYQLGHEDMTL